MVFKSIVQIGLFVVPLVLVNFGVIHSAGMLIAMYLVSGLGMAGIGMGVMHDAMHGSYSRNRWVNQLLGNTMNLIGGNHVVWKFQHNVLHHSYTNIEAYDDDLDSPFFLRFSPHGKRLWIHRYQHLYTWFFYGLATISKVTVKDFLRLHKYYRMGLIRSRSTYLRYFAGVAIWKVIYFGFALVLPAILTPFSFWIILFAFLLQHFLLGIYITMVFQSAHVVPGTTFPLPNNHGEIESERLEHQMHTTSNFSRGNRVFTWWIGALNYQVEHHLFPNICHVHYRDISKIVEDTAREFGIPYHSKKTFIGAIADHTKMLRFLGRKNMLGA